MEVFAIGLWILGGIPVAPLFCYALIRLVRPHPKLSRAAYYLSLLLLIAFCIDLLLVLLWGAVGTRQRLGPAFIPVNAMLTLGSAAFLAGSLLLGPGRFVSRWRWVAAICWMLGVFSIFHVYGVGDALYGVDGRGGPYAP